MDSEHLEAIADGVRSTLDAADAAREQALVFSRATVRRSATAIRLVHQGRMGEAEDQVLALVAELAEFMNGLADQPRVAAAPFVSDAEKEIVEAWATISLATGRPLPTPGDVGCRPSAYLNGLAEAATEIRRYVVDAIRRDHLEEAEQILSRMDGIYGVLVTFDYPDAILEGLKRRLDTVRGVIEKTRHDVTAAVRQQRLLAAMTELDAKLGAGQAESGGHG